MRWKSLARNSGATVCGGGVQAFAVERLDKSGGRCTQRCSFQFLRACASEEPMLSEGDPAFRASPNTLPPPWEDSETLAMILRRCHHSTRSRSSRRTTNSS